MTEESFLCKDMPLELLLSTLTIRSDETTMVAVCSDVETGLGIMAGCFMVMRRGFSFFNKSNEKDIPKGYVTPQFVSQTSDSTLRVEYV